MHVEALGHLIAQQLQGARQPFGIGWGSVVWKSDGIGQYCMGRKQAYSRGQSYRRCVQCPQGDERQSTLISLPVHACACADQQHLSLLVLHPAGDALAHVEACGLGRKVIPLAQVFARVSPEQKELVLQVSSLTYSVTQG